MSLVEEENKMNQAFESIPVIDLTDVRSSDEAVLRRIAQNIKNACMESGFFYVKNHGIQDATLRGVVKAMEEFFALPLELKLAIENVKNPSFKGYSPLYSGHNDPNNKGDFQEGFEFGWEPLQGHDSTATIPAVSEDEEYSKHDLSANAWPVELPQFRVAALKYYHAALELGKLLFPLFALALGLPKGFFEDKTRHSAALMRLLYYPPQAGPTDEVVMGIGQHTDWECFTILWQQPGIQALQVLNSEGQWIDAPAIEGTLVINLGDQFARWTNDIFKSTVHRAANRSRVQRYAIPLFFGTDYNVRLEPIPGCVSPERPCKYEVVTAGEYVRARLKATYGH
ncbi:Clavaminate synthase-like protein [Fistulina hepatica ATCC 64428]|uniref:Clavaminate synthase-like protein n=1 Tax=Fistulina hepatica ATCC 64428 TaxID=1128425 RepID=A0A0D7AMA0_9AGAR|nr:Clavaminate synthase-like protein [Fistulina hepatica ATCC 64428]